jgi:TRAP-type C4-dicarboxylate transport system substrate-binding protein
MLAVMSRQRWESLPEDVQQVIDELGAEASQYAGHYLDNHVREAITWAQDNHNLEIVTLSEEEQKRWTGRIEPLNEQRIEQVAAQGLPAEELYDRMLALIEQYQQ